MQPYIHQIPGRIRVRSLAIKQDTKSAATLSASLAQAEGITKVTHKLYAGSIAVEYDTDIVQADTLLSVFESHDLLREDLQDDTVSRLVVGGTKLAGRTLLTVAAQKLLGPKGVSLLGSI